MFREGLNLKNSATLKRTRLIVVLGMHRSGTSVITRGLKVMGVALGDRLMPPVEGINAKGFWEDIDLCALNNEVLSALGSDWHDLVSIEPSDVQTLRKKGHFPSAVQLLRQKVGSAPIFGFKDPRVAKLLPFWKEVFSHCQLDASYVLALRHPLSVAKSLARRDGFDAEKSYLLWLEHVIPSLSGSAGDKRVLVDYDRLMQSPDHELKRIAKCLDLEIDVRELRNYKTEFLDEELRHTVYDPNDLFLDDACPPLAREIYAALLDVASDKTRIDDLALRDQIARWVGEFKRLKSYLALADRISIRKAAANQAVAERDAQVVYLKAVVERDRQARRATLNQIQSSRGRPSLQHYYRLRDNLFPAIKKISEAKFLGTLPEPESPRSAPRQETPRQVTDAQQHPADNGDTRNIVRRSLALLFPRYVIEGIHLLRDMTLIAASGLFDRDWYLVQNPDVASAGVSPLRHYLRLGAVEGRDPNPHFDSDWYLKRNPDVAKAGVNPLIHYLRRGALEGRKPNPDFDGDRSGTPRVAVEKCCPISRLAGVASTGCAGRHSRRLATAKLAPKFAKSPF